MMECKYSIGKGPYVSYQELVDYIAKSENIDNVLSILFSQDQDNVYKHLVDLKNKKEYQFKTWSKNKAKIEESTSRMLNGEPLLEVGDTDMSLQQFIDSGYFRIDGERPMFQLNFEEYLEIKKKELVDQKRMPEQDAVNHIKLLKERWEKIADDAFVLHKLLVSTHGTNGRLDWDDIEVTNTAFEAIPRRILDASNTIIQYIFQKNGSSKTGMGDKGRLIKNINLPAQLKDHKFDLIGHIDYLIVRDDGDVEIFNIKSSIEDYSNWDSVKKTKYRYQMALLKRILEHNGIPAKTVRTNIIPVRMTYNSDFSQVVDLHVDHVKSIDFKDTEYILTPYEKIAEQFIPSKITLGALGNDTVDKLNKQLQKLFPGRDIKTTGLAETAKTWLDRYWNQLQPKPLDEGGWEITIPGEKKSRKISDSRKGSKNEEIVGIIQDNLKDISDNVQNQHGIYRIIKDIKQAYDKSGFYSPVGEYGSYLHTQLSKYFVHPKDNFNYTWKLETNPMLEAAGILLFVNNYTGQMDVVTLTNYDVEGVYQFNGKNNLLGYYIPDLNNEGFELESNYGNMEVMRTMLILNEVLPNIQGKFKLGELKVLGVSHQFHNKKGILYDFSRLTPHFNTVVSVLNKNTDLKMHNNFKEKNFKYVDQAELLFQLWQDFTRSELSSGMSEIKALNEYITSKQLVDGTVVDGLMKVDTVEAKVAKLEMLIDKLKQLAQDRGIKLGDTEALIQMSKRISPDTTPDINAVIATLFITATKALNQFYGDLSLENKKFGSMSEYFLKTYSINNANVRQVGFMFQKSIDKIASDMVNRYTPIKEIFMQFYEDAGYTKTQNALVGNQASVYLNLYETDQEGNRLMQFKNPYDNFNDLKDYERKFLKKVLYEFHKLRCEVIGIKNDIKGPEDPKLKTNMPSKYLNVPLERSSTSTRRTQMKKGFEQWGKRVMRRILKPGEAFEELQGVLGADDVRSRQDDLLNLQAYNPFTNSEKSDNVRKSYIADKGVDYFEFNVENLLIDFMEKHVQAEEFTKMLVRAKGIELDLLLRGEVESDKENTERTLNTIRDFLSLNVYNKSIMEDGSQKLEAWLAPIRSAVSTFYVAGNIKGAVRDSFQGLLENITTALIQFQTDISVSDVAFGYKEVISEGVTNLMTATKLNQFNLKYRLSNLDAARISEGQKTGRGGILNAENWAYATLRGPDYLNRMVLFVARLKHDGCYDAYSLDADHRLKYDWRKDKRFNLLAKGPEGASINKELYNKQKALYYSLIRAFNLEGYKKENGEQLNYSDDLPDAYTLSEVQSFKLYADNIYGSYNKSTKAKYEHTAIGRNFAFFSTWMNGIVDVYMKETQVSQGEFKLEQEVDYNGNLLYFTEDGNITEVNTGIPVMKGVPIMVQGVCITVQQIAKTLYYCGYDNDGKWSFSKGWKVVQTDILSNEVAQRNLRRLARDILVGLLFAQLFKSWLRKKYNKFKEEANGDEFIKNAVTEIMYAGGTSCFDTFLGPMAIVDYIGNQTNPATYRLQSKLFHDAWALAAGEKTPMQVFIGSQALPRTFQDTYKLWKRDNVIEETT